MADNEIEIKQARAIRKALDEARDPDSRIVMIRIFVQDSKVLFEMVTPLINQTMLMWDVETEKDTEAAQDESERSTLVLDHNKNLPDDEKKTVSAGKRVKASDYVRELQYPHAGIHLFRKKNGGGPKGDQILWFSDQPINFRVEIHRDPQLILLPKEVQERPDVTPNKGVDNPFEKTFPLYSYNGAPVVSGYLKTDDEIKEQKYFKYVIYVEGITEPLDPHIEGHWE